MRSPLTAPRGPRAAACVRAFAALATLLLAACLFETSRTAGGGSDIGNGGAIAGIVLAADGRPAGGVRVRLRPRDYLAPLPAALKTTASAAGTARPPEAVLDTLGETLTRADGTFGFSGLDTGAYRLEILDSAAARGALVDCEVAAARPRVELPEARLSPTGGIRLQGPSDSSLSGAFAWVRVRGLERLARLEPGRELVLPLLPAGAYALRTDSRHPSLAGLEARAVVASGDTLLIRDLAAPCGDRACDSAVVAEFLSANGLPDSVATVANAEGRVNNLVLEFPDTSLRLRTLGGLRRLSEVRMVRVEGPLVPDSLGEAFFDALGQMDSLWFLRLAGAGDRGLKSVPSSLGRLTALRQLYLQDDSLASIPEETGNLTRLEMLFLRGNRLQALPQSLGNLRALTELHVPFNRLTAIPDTVLRLPRLVKVDVFGNRLCVLTGAQKAALAAKGADTGPGSQVCE